MTTPGLVWAVTVGEAVCAEIARLFAANEPALGAMLDSVASEATELASEQAEAHYRGHLRFASRLGPEAGVLPFSPGYCGWHVSGQRKLFEYLDPGEIGISLKDSFMMSPLKSVSGLLITAEPDAHRFKPRFSYCPECKDHSCVERIRQLPTPNRLAS